MIKKYRILIVDDNEKFIEAFTYLLNETLNDQIELIDSVSDGTKFLNELKEKIYDIIFMDINMPVLDGIEATRMAVRLYRDIRIVAVSFHEELDYIKLIIEAGAKNYLIKEEITKEKLLKVMKSL